MSKPRHPKRPISKATARLLESLRRKSGIRDLAPRVLIVCEDEKSSPNYFIALKREFRLTAAIVGSGHFSQPIQVVQRALQRKQAAADEGDAFDSVWCVIDGDYGTRINNARACARANDIALAISTQCFEYWILLHFEESAVLTEKCEGLIARLKRHVANYEKGAFDFTEIVKSARIAAERARRLREPRIEIEPLPENHNPCSEIYKLIERLLPD